MFSRTQGVNGFLMCTIMMYGYASDVSSEDTKAFSINWVSYGDADSNVVQVEADTITDSIIAVDSQFTLEQDFSSCCDMIDEVRDYPYYKSADPSGNSTTQQLIDALSKREFSIDWAALGDSNPTILQIEASDISATIVIDGVANIDQMVSDCCEQLAKESSNDSTPVNIPPIKIKKIVIKKGDSAGIQWKTMNDSHPTIVQITAHDMPVTLIANVNFFVEVQSAPLCGIYQAEGDLASFHQIADTMNDEVGEMEALEHAPKNWRTWIACRCALKTLVDLILAKSRQLCELSGIC